MKLPRVLVLFNEPTLAHTHPDAEPEHDILYTAAVDALPVPKCPLKWPVIVKPGTEDASVGIEQASVVTSQKQLEDRVRYVLDAYGPPVLVEQFVRGREFNVAVWDRDGTPRTLPFS